MKPLPQSQAALVIRTDFSDQEAWDAIGAAILQLTEEGFGAQVEFVDDAGYRGATKEHSSTSSRKARNARSSS
jgi:hypothetical protein